MRAPLNMILFCSDGATKQRFKESFQAGKFDVKIHLANQPEEVEARIKGHLVVDFVLIANGPYDIRIELVKKLSTASAEFLPPPIFVLVKESERAGALLSTLLSAGADGVIAEPLRVEAVEDAVEHMLSSTRYANFREHRDKAIIKVTFTNAALFVDHLAHVQLGKATLTTEQYKEKARLHESMVKLWDSCGGDDYANTLLSVCAARLPFAERVVLRPGRRKKVVLHPAKIVTRIMTVRGISADKLASAMRMDPAIISQFLNETCGMTDELAENFGRVLGHDKEYWLGLSGSVDTKQLT